MEAQSSDSICFSSLSILCIWHLTYFIEYFILHMYMYEYVDTFLS